MKLKKLLLTTSTIGAALSPVAVVISCGKDEKHVTVYKNGEVKGRKVVAQSFEPIDFLSTFGLKPDLYVTRSDQGVYMDALPKYLKDKLDTKLDDLVKYDTKIYDWNNKQSFNPSDMLKKLDNKKGVLLSYQSLHAADEAIKQAFNGAIYDDLGNDSGIGSYPGTIKLGDNYTQPRMYDVVKNYKVFTKGLDTLYGTDYIKTAEANATKFSNYVKDFKTKNSAKLNGKTILFVRPNEKVTNQATANNIAIWAPLAYNLFYADEAHNGLGMTFPTPKTGSWPQSTKDGGYFDPWAINTRNNDKANVSTKVVEEYTGTADYVVYLTNEAAWNNPNDSTTKGYIENTASNVAKLLKTPAQAEKNIILADYSTFYRGMYGIVGQQDVLQKMVAAQEWKTAIPGLTSANTLNEILNTSATLSKLSELE